jgi:integrase
VNAPRSTTPPAVLSDEEFLTLWRALEAIGDPAYGEFATQAYTGAAARTVAQMRWRDLDFDAATWTLPPDGRPSGKPRESFVIHLHPQLQAMIRRQPMREDSPYVFGLPGMIKLIAVRPALPPDLSAFVLAGMARIRVPEAVARMCVEHRPRADVAETRQAWQNWGSYLTSLRKVPA